MYLFIYLYLLLYASHVPTPASFTNIQLNSTTDIRLPKGWAVEKNNDNITAIRYLTAFTQIYQFPNDNIKTSTNNGLTILFKKYNYLVTDKKWDYTENKPYYEFDLKYGAIGMSTSYFAKNHILGISWEVRGYYIVLIDDKYNYVIVCECREGDWQNLKYAFQEIVNSIH